MSCRGMSACAFCNCNPPQRLRDALHVSASDMSRAWPGTCPDSTLLRSILATFAGLGEARYPGRAVQRILARLAVRPLCPELEPECFRLPFCEAWRCAVLLRRGLTGELAHCPVTGVAAAVQYPGHRGHRAAA